MWEYGISNNGELYHHGIKGQKWGIRRFQNTDGSYTSAGKKRYTASNGVTVTPPKSKANALGRRIGASRLGDRLGSVGYDTAANRQSHKETYAIREYNAHQKDLRKGTGDEYLNKTKARNAKDAAKAERREKIKDVYNKIDKEASLTEKELISNSTRKKAAKYVVDKNMSIKDAKDLATAEAIRATNAVMAYYAGTNTAYRYY